MKGLLRCLRYDWPLHFVLFLTNWLPDNVVFLRLRGALARPFFGCCGSDLRLGRNLSFYNPSLITLGNRVYIAYGCNIISIDNVYIGDEVMLAPYVVISSGNHSRFNGSYRDGLPDKKPVIIGSGTWVGSHVSILAGAKIGKCCLVGSQACVTSRNFSDNVFLAGVPAMMKTQVNNERRAIDDE